MSDKIDRIEFISDETTFCIELQNLLKMKMKKIWNRTPKSVKNENVKKQNWNFKMKMKKIWNRTPKHVKIEMKIELKILLKMRKWKLNIDP